MLPHFAQVREVTDVIADAVFIDVLKDLFFAGEFFGEGERLPDRAGVAAAASDVVDLSGAGGFDEFPDKRGDVVGMDVVADLFALVSENLVFTSFEVALHEVTQKSVEFDSTVVGAGETAATEAAGGESEVASIFLHHDIGGDF